MTTYLTVEEDATYLDIFEDARDAIKLWGRAIDSAAPDDEDVLAWDSATSEWVPTDIDDIITGTYVDVTGDTMTGDLVMDASDVKPLANGTGNLGLTGTRWANGFFDALDATAITGVLQTAAQPNVTSLGTIAALVATTADINGGTIDGTNIGVTVQGSGAFTTLTGNDTVAFAKDLPSAVYTFTFDNTRSTNPDAHARMSVRSGGPNGGDPAYVLELIGQINYYWGIDNSDSDKLIIGLGTTVGVTPFTAWDSSGNATFSGTVTSTGDLTVGASKLVVTASNGAMTWGGDTTLYRVLADTLKTDDAFIVTGLITATSGITSAANITIGGSAVAAVRSLTLSTAAAQTREIVFQSGGVNRWNFTVTNTAEAGANAGSDFLLIARNDAGGTIGYPLAITRSTMAATFSGTLTSTGDLTVGASKFVVTASTGNLVSTAGATFGDDVVFSADGDGLKTDTADGADNQCIKLTGGGIPSITRGAVMVMCGNEHADTGDIQMFTGNVAGSEFVLSVVDATRLTVTATAATFTNAVTINTSVSSAFPNTVSGIGLMVTTNDGSVQEIMRDSSTRREKIEIVDAAIDPAKVLAIRAQEYGREAQPGLRFTGFCVEDFHEAGFGNLLDYNERGQPTAFREYGRGITALQQVVLQDHEARIKELEEELAMLKAA